MTRSNQLIIAMSRGFVLSPTWHMQLHKDTHAGARLRPLLACTDYSKQNTIRHVCLNLYIHIYYILYTHIHIHIRAVFIFECTCIYVYIHTHTYMYTYICTNICTCNIYVYIHIPLFCYKYKRIKDKGYLNIFMRI